MFGSYQLSEDDSVLTSWANKWFYWSLIGTRPCNTLRYVGDEAVCSPGNPYLAPSHPRYKNPHQVPAPNHSCGFYAYHKLERLASVPLPGGVRMLQDVINNPLHYLSPVGTWSETGLSSPPNPPGGPAAVVALVQGYGRVIVHDTTYRAQKMRIAALCSDGKHTRELVEAHADNLGIPALSLKEMEEYAEYAGICLA